MNKGKIEIIGTPDQLKNRLLEKHVNLAAIDEKKLKSELSGLGIDFSETPEGSLKVIYHEQTPQLLLSRITTPLTKLAIDQPTLEEAYLELIKEGSTVSC